MSKIKTLTGIDFDYENPTVEMFNIKDIAYGLANEKRYVNQTNPLFSVGQHSIFVSHLLYVDSSSDNINALAGLFHDASEVYLKDIASPLKYMPEMEGYRVIENKIQGLAYQFAGLNEALIDVARLHKMDLLARAYEKLFLKGEWVEGFKPEANLVKLFKTILKWAPLETEIEFIAEFLVLKTD